MSESISQYLLHIAAGNAEASEKVWKDYFGKLVRLAQRKLEGFPNRDFDEEDIAISAMNSFYQGIANNKFENIHNREDLWKLLVTITARKATAKRRAQFSQKRGGGQVRGESIFFQTDDDQAGIADILGTEPTPEFALSVAEDCRALLEQLPDDTLRQIALWTLEGYRTEEIATKLGCVRRTVERKLERIREIWEEQSERG